MAHRSVLKDMLLDNCFFADSLDALYDLSASSFGHVFCAQ